MVAALAVLALLIGLSSFGDTPDTRDTTEQVAAYFTDHRVAVLVGVVLVGVGVLAFLDVVLRQLDGVDEQRFVRLAQGAAAVALAVVFLGLLLPYAGLAYVVGAESPGDAKAIFSMTLVSTPILALPLAVLFGVLAWTGREGRRWFAVVTGLAALVFAWSACSWMASGPMSPDVQQQVVFQLLVVWLVCAGVVQRRGRATG